MNFESTSVALPQVDSAQSGIPLEEVKAALLEESRAAGDRDNTTDNKNGQWTVHLRILAQQGVTTTGQANRTAIKNALKTFRETPHRITGKPKKNSAVLTHAVQVGCFWRQAWVHRFMDSHLLEGAVLPKADQACIVVPRDEDAPVVERAIHGYHSLEENPSMRFSRNGTYLERHYQRSMVIYCLAISSGLRRFEIHNLKIDDIDFGGRMITLTETKGRTARAVPMSPRTAAEIKALIALLPVNARTGHLIRGEMGGSMTPAAVSRQFERIIAWGIGQGLPLREFTLHSLRHKAISDMLQVSDEHARVMAGHKDVRITIKVYGHTTIKDVQASHNKADIFSRLAAQPKPVTTPQKPPRQNRVF